MSDAPPKIVILGDSICLPRAKGAGNIPFESTYPYLLDRALRDRYGAAAPVVIECGMRSRTIDDVVADWHEEVYLKQPDIVIVHVGGNDCAPRVFQNWERRLLEGLPLKRFRTQMFRLEKKFKRSLLLFLPHRVYVPMSRFRRRVEEIVHKAQHQKLKSLIFVTILPVTDRVEHTLPGVSRSVELYSRVYLDQAGKDRISVVDMSRLAYENGGLQNISLDGMHVNEAGHRMLAREFERIVVEILGEHHAGRAAMGGRR